MTNTTNTTTTIETSSSSSKIEYTCKHCGQVYLTLDMKYVQDNPNASDMCVEQAFDRHVSGECAHSHEYNVEDICPDCGEVIWSGDREYVTRYPNGSDMARAQAAEEHSHNCPAQWESEWKEWHSKYGDITPCQLLIKTLATQGPAACYDIDTPPDRISYAYGQSYDNWYDEIEEFLHKFSQSPNSLNWRPMVRRVFKNPVRLKVLVKEYFPKGFRSLSPFNQGEGHKWNPLISHMDIFDGDDETPKQAYFFRRGYERNKKFFACTE